MISMNKKLAITVSLIIILCFSLAGQVFAVTSSPGVRGGDYFTYSISSYWTSTNTSLTVPEYLLENNNTKWFNVSISSVIGANVTATNLWEYNNGTTGNSLVVMEVDNATVYFALENLPAFLGFFNANQSVNDLLLPLSNNDVRINSTINREYAGGNRETNVVSVSYAVTDYYNTSLGTETITYYIDKATGVLVERIDFTEFPDQTGSVTWKLTDTNAWTFSIKPFSWLDILGIVIVIVIIVVVIVLFIMSRRNRGRKSKR